MDTAAASSMTSAAASSPMGPLVTPTMGNPLSTVALVPFRMPYDTLVAAVTTSPAVLGGTSSDFGKAVSMTEPIIRLTMAMQPADRWKV